MTTQTFNIQEKMTDLFNKYGVFFAFNQKQFDEQKKEGVEYARIVGGGLVPAENFNDFNKAFNELFEEEKTYNLKNFDKETLILKELINHEAFYTYDLTDVYEYLNEKYEFSYEEVEAVFDKHKANYD